MSLINKSKTKQNKTIRTAWHTYVYVMYSFFKNLFIPQDISLESNVNEENLKILGGYNFQISLELRKAFKYSYKPSLSVKLAHFILFLKSLTINIPSFTYKMS